MDIIPFISNYPKPYVLCIICEAEGSTPGKPGFKMVVFPDGSIKGTVGGGDIERYAIDEATKLLNSKDSCKTCSFILNQEYAKEKIEALRTAMACGGSAKIYFEKISNKERIVIFGGGHIAQSLSTIAINMGFSVEICDNRPDYATPDRYPLSSIIRTGLYPELVTATDCNDLTYCLILTHGHAHDAIVLEKILQLEKQPKYIGMIGSKFKVKKTIEKMMEKGISENRLARVYSPIGLAIGGDNPTELAISILSEIQVVRFEKKAIHMKDI